MSRLRAATAAVAIIASGSAFGAANIPPAVTAGQYAVTNQFTATIDPGGVCSGLGLVPGAVFKGVATVGSTDFSKPIVQELNQVILPGGSTPAGIAHISCSLPGFVAGTTFSKNADGSYTATPSSSLSSCTNTNSGSYSPTPYTLSSSNGTSSNTGAAQTLSTTVFHVTKGSVSSGFRVVATNTDLLVGGSTFICAISTDATYFRTGT